MDSVSVAYVLTWYRVWIWQCRCEDPNNLNDQIQGPCNDAAAGPNGSARVLEEPGPKAVGCRTMNRSMRMHEQYHVGFRGKAVEKNRLQVFLIGLCKMRKQLPQGCGVVRESFCTYLTLHRLSRFNDIREHVVRYTWGIPKHGTGEGSQPHWRS